MTPSPAHLGQLQRPARISPTQHTIGCHLLPAPVLQVSAVSPKTNTTEAARLGAFTLGPSQVVLYDTPGVVDQK